MIFWIYQLGYFFTLLAALLLAAFSSKLRRAIKGRIGLQKRIKTFRARMQTPPIWFQVASSGELEQCLPVMDEIKRLKPQQSIFLSYFSPSAESAIRAETGRRSAANLKLPWDHIDYSPLDLTWVVSAFLKALRPSQLVCVHREIWPALLKACQKDKIPCALIAAYFPPINQRRIQAIRPWLTYFNFIGTTGDVTSARLKPVLPNSFPLNSWGDPRIDRVLQRRQMRKASAWQSFFEGPVFLASSVWPQDFQAIQAGIKILMAQTPRWRILVAPHEPHSGFVQQLMVWLKDNSQVIPVRRWSHWLREPDSDSHLIIDQVGHLAEIYQVASLVFVGGSFKRRVHNVLEPAAYGKPIMTGPLIQNSGEATEMLAAGALVKVDGGEEFSEHILKLSTNLESRRVLGLKAYQYLQDRQGASSRYAQALLSSDPMS